MFEDNNGGAGAPLDNLTEDDIEIVNSYLVWGAVGIHYANQYSKIHHQKFVNDFLLSVVK